MYNTKFDCRYYKDDVFLETDKVTEHEKNFIRNYLYKEDLLSIFFIDYGDGEYQIINSINQLYQKLKDCKPLKEYMKIVSLNTLYKEDEIDGLCILYSYDYMYITHKCVSEYLETGIISEENINLLNKSVNNIL